MGAVLAMVVGVSVFAALTTVITKNAHKALTRATPKPAQLQGLLDTWREELASNRKGLIKLKDGELDLLAMSVTPDPKLLKAKNRQTGYLRTIYKEDIAHYVLQQYPRAKEPHTLLLVQTATAEYVYRTTGTQTFVTVNGTAAGVLEGDVLYAKGGGAETARRDPQRDGRSVHVDVGDRTLAILLKPGTGTSIEPRAFELVDSRSAADRSLIELLSFEYLLNENLAL